MHNLDQYLKVVQSHKPDAWAAAAALSSAIDTQGYDEMIIIANAGTVEATTTVNIKATECAASGGSYTDVSGAAFTEITAANDVAVYVGRIDLSKRLRYFKISMTLANDVGDMAVTVLLARHILPPVSQTATLAFRV